MAYASGKFAYALCDRCGFKYKYKDLIIRHAKVVVNKKWVIFTTF